MADFLVTYWDQILIALTGVTAIALTQTKADHTRRWAPVLGLVGQVGWFWASFQAQQWGIFLLTFAYTATWFYGFWVFWIAPRLAVPTGTQHG